MQTLKIGRSAYRLAPTRNVGELQLKLSKCTGKFKPSAIGRERRSYPTFKPGDSTADYVKAFYGFNGLRMRMVDEDGEETGFPFFAPLNTEPCALYTGEDTHETIGDQVDAIEHTGAPEPAAMAPEVFAETIGTPEPASAPAASAIHPDAAIGVAPVLSPTLAAFDALAEDPTSPKPIFSDYAYARKTGRTVVARCASPGGWVTIAATCAEKAGMRYVRRARGYVGTPAQALKTRAAFVEIAAIRASLAPVPVHSESDLIAQRYRETAAHLRERVAEGAGALGERLAQKFDAMAGELAPVPGESAPAPLPSEADDEKTPAPLDGLDVAELGPEALEAFEPFKRPPAVDSYDAAPAYWDAVRVTRADETGPTDAGHVAELVRIARQACSTAAEFEQRAARTYLAAADPLREYPAPVRASLFAAARLIADDATAAYLAEFEAQRVKERADDLRERARAAVAAPTPSLRIPGGDLRSRIPARFAPVYILNA